MFPIVQVNSRTAESLEQLGAKRKFWLADGGQQMLLKLQVTLLTKVFKIVLEEFQLNYPII